MDPYRILLVEDEVDLAHSLRRALQQEGYEVTLAGDGLAAAELLGLSMQARDPVSSPAPTHQPSGEPSGQHFDLLILDWMLPHYTGLQLCHRLHQDKDPRPVLFLTAKDTLDDRVNGLDAGADDYLVKPFELRELLARVRALLRRQIASPEDPERIQVGDLVLEVGSQVVYCQGRAIQLSDKETQLLALLMEHPGQLLTHQQIYDTLWPQEDRPSSNVLAAQIRLLRRKIEGSPDQPPLIQTVYRKGYRLSAGIPEG